MQLLTNGDYRNSLFARLQAAHTSLYLTSAYITTAGIVSILENLKHKQLNGPAKVLARWDARDLVCGASDLEVYEAVVERGHEFYVNPKLHGKFALIDDSDLFSGSANFTAAGLHLGIHGNWECGTRYEPSESDIDLIEALFDNSIMMTPTLFAEISAFVVSLRREAQPENVVFPAHIANQLQGWVEGLWVREMLWTSNPPSLQIADANARHDALLLGLSTEQSCLMQDLGMRFAMSRCCKWLVYHLEQRNGQLYFGEVSHLLHDALLEDPKPYRKDIKTLVQNLFVWSTSALPDVFVVDAPSHSQRIRLL